MLSGSLSIVLSMVAAVLVGTFRPCSIYLTLTLSYRPVCPLICPSPPLKKGRALCLSSAPLSPVASPRSCCCWYLVLLLFSIYQVLSSSSPDILGPTQHYLTPIRRSHIVPRRMVKMGPGHVHSTRRRPLPPQKEEKGRRVLQRMERCPLITLDLVV